MKEITINCIAVALGFGLGIMTTNVINNIAQPTTKQDPQYIGVYYTDNWNTRESAKIEINADGSCNLPGNWRSFANTECTYTVKGDKVYFYDSENISATVGADGIMYGEYYFKRLK